MFTSLHQGLRTLANAAFGRAWGPAPAQAGAPESKAGITRPPPSSLVGYVHIGDRKAQPLNPVKFVAGIVLSDLAGQAGRTWSKAWLGTEEDDPRPYRIASALGGLAAVACHVVGQKLYDDYQERAERRLVAERGLTPHAQIDRVIELANAQPLNADGLKRSIHRLTGLHWNFPGPARDMVPLAQDVARLGAGALHLPPAADKAAQATCVSELRLLTTAIRAMGEIGGITPAQSIAALHALRQAILARLPDGLNTTLRETLRAFIGGEIAAVTQGQTGASERISLGFPDR